ncbi:MAG TPA: secretin N-terminal domain-containing protein, partial [Gemmatimonadales bacterium]|nr:secretin N-terminal domain-containing protein [Gemmatimonadales bacterium]
MKPFFALVAAGLLVAAPRGPAAPGEVRAVSVLPSPGLAEVVIDVTGAVSFEDFTLSSPPRLVVDVTGATLLGTAAAYDGVNRGGIVNLRYAQYRPDVVRVVLEFEDLRDYTIVATEGAIRVSVGADRTFAAWSSLDPRALAEAAAGRSLATPYAELPPVVAPPQDQQPRVTVTYDSAAITDVMAGFAEFSGRSIVLGKQVTGSVTAEIKNQPWDVAFQAILTSQGLSAVEEPSGIIRVDNPAILAQRDSLEPLTTKIVRVNYVRAGNMIPALAAVLSTRGKVVADTATNSLIITDVESRVAQDSAFVAQLDVRTPQVSIHAKLIFVDRTNIENLGVRYDLGTSRQFFNRLIQRPDPSTTQGQDLNGDGVPDIFTSEPFEQDETIVDIGGNALSAIGNAQALLQGGFPALNLIFSTALGGYSITTFVEALQRVELADLQAEPLITTADNTEAQIQVGQRTPIRQIDVGTGQQAARATTEIVPTGIILRVTPHVTSSRQILMQLHAENSSVVEAPADVGFTFQTQEADNQILVRDGETAVIGGLTVTDISVSKSGIPLLVDLPIIGRLFGFTNRREQRRDLLILVTPRIIDDG